MSGTASVVPVNPDRELLSRVERYVTAQLKARAFPGAGLAIGAGGRVLFARGFGLADVEHAVPVEPDTAFQIASVTKSITATAVLRLRDEGLIDLDAPIHRYLPWFRMASPEAAESITVRHLLTHTSGIPGSAINVVWKNADQISGSMLAAAKELAYLRLDRRAGERYEYSNMGYVLLGLVVEAVTGVSWHEYVHTQIFIPLGMAHSTADFPHTPDLKLARPYSWHLGGRRLVRESRLGPYLAAAGSTSACSAADLVQFGLMHLREVPEVISPGSLAEAHHGVVTMPLGGMKYGLGWVESRRKDGLRAVWHNGSGDGCSSILLLLPDQGLVVAMLTNIKALPDLVVNGVIEILLGREPKATFSCDPVRIALGYVPLGLTLLSGVLVIWAVIAALSASGGVLLGVASALSLGVALFLGARRPFSPGLPLRRVSRYFPGIAMMLVSLLVAGVVGLVSWLLAR